MKHLLAPADSDQSGIAILGLLGPGTWILILIPMAFALAVALTSWLLIRRARRSGVLRRIHGGVGNVVNSGLLKMRAETGQGLGRELAQKRLRLRAALDSTARSLDEARVQQRPVGELSSILDTLIRAGAVLDGQLRLAEREPDEGARRTLAAAFNGQLEMIEHTARDIRATLAQAGLPLSGADLDQVTARLAIETQVLQSWTRAYLASANPAIGIPHAGTRYSSADITQPQDPR